MPSTYTIGQGDSLWGLAAKYGGGGQNWGAINAANGGSLNPRALKIGQVIKMPTSWGSTAATPQAPATTPTTSSSTPTTASASGGINNPSMNMNTDVATAQNILKPGYDASNKILNDSISNTNQVYNQARQTGTNLMGSLDSSTNDQIGKIEQGRQGQINALNAQNQAGQKQINNWEFAGVGNVLANANGFSAGGNGTSTNGVAGGAVVNNPFMASEAAAATQPYVTQLKQLNQQTAVDMANANASAWGIESQLKNATNAQKVAIGTAMMQLAPQQASTIATLNTALASNDTNYSNGVIDKAVYLQNQAQLYSLQKQSFKNAINVANIGANAQITSAGIGANAQIKSAGIGAAATTTAATTAANAGQNTVVPGAFGRSTILDRHGNMIGWMDVFGNYSSGTAPSAATPQETAYLKKYGSGTGGNNTPGSGSTNVSGINVSSNPLSAFTRGGNGLQGSSSDLSILQNAGALPISR